MRAIGRLFAALLGYMLAILAAAAFLVLASTGTWTPEPGVEALRWWIEFAIAYGWATSLVGAAAFVPAVVFILIGEIAAIRSLVVHLIFGGALGAAAGFGLSSRLTMATADGRGMLMLVGAGFVGAFVYWVVAGRMAGLGDRPDGPKPPDA